MKRLLVAIVSLACLASPAWGEAPANPLARGDKAGFRVACKNHYILISPCDSGSVEGWTWSPAGVMNIPRALHTASLLPDGTVLVAGGVTGAATDLTLRSAEIYDPRVRQWRLTGEMAVERHLHQAIPLMDGNVMAVGGFSHAMAPNAPFAEIYDVSRSAWRPASAGEYRSEPSVTLLADGRVLISGGGSDTFEPLSSAVIYDPASDSFRHTSPLAHPRMGHYSVRLDDGKVLVFGGVCDNWLRTHISDVEVFDPLAETWTPAPDLEAPHEGSTTALMPGGKVVVIGGEGYDPRDEPLYAGCPGSRINEAALASAIFPNVDVFDAGAWHSAAAMSLPRLGHASTQLTTGHLVTTGGAAWKMPAESGATEVLDPHSLRWTEAAPLAQARAFHAATRLADGRVLVTGGYSHLGNALSYCRWFCQPSDGPYIHRDVIGSAEILGPQ